MPLNNFFLILKIKFLFVSILREKKKIEKHKSSKNDSKLSEDDEEIPVKKTKKNLKNTYINKIKNLNEESFQKKRFNNHFNNSFFKF